MKILIVLASVFVLTYCKEECEICPPIPKLYDELGCVGKKDDRGCCFERFECPDLTKYDTKKCHLKGKTYSIKEKAPEEDLPICMNHCRCTDVKGKAEFVCPKSECAGYKSTPESAGCQHMFTENSCCSKPICEKVERTTCEYNGKVYHEGTKFYPDDVPCHSCVCHKNFNASLPMETNKFCRKIDCGLELRYFNKIKEGCVPVYFQTSACCPIDFKCPNESDEFIRLPGRSKKPDVIPEKMCKYGNNTLLIGERLKSKKPCISCSCKQPPMLECIQTNYC